MKTPVTTLIFAILLTVGCAHFNYSANETKPDGTEIATKVKAFTFFDSKSELSKLKTSTTDKTQSLGIGTLNQEAEGSNAVNIVNSVVSAAVTAAIKSTVKP